MAPTIYVAVLLLISAGLRLWGISEQSLWLDEATSLEVATRSIGDILGGSAFNNHTPPFYYLILHYWLYIFGATVSSLRLFSTVFDVGNCFLVYLVFSRQFGQKIGRASGLVYALSPFAIYYAQEGRMYPLTVFLVLATYWFLLDALQKPLSPPKAGALVFVATLGMYTHYYYALTLFAFSVGLYFYNEKNSRSTAVWFLCVLNVGLLFLPWLREILEIASGEGQVFRRFVWTVIPYAFFRFCAGYGVFPLTNEAKADMGRAVIEHIFLVAPFLVCFIPILVVGLNRLYKEKKRELVILLSIITLVPLTALAISLVTPMLSERYLIVVYPFFCVVVAGFFVTEFRSKIFSSSKLIAGGLILFSLYQHYFNPQAGFTEWDKAVDKAVNGEPQLQEIAVNPGYCASVVKYYAPKNWRVVEVEQVMQTRCDHDYWLLERQSSPSVGFLLSSKGCHLVEYAAFPKESGLSLKLVSPIR